MSEFDDCAEFLEWGEYSHSPLTIFTIMSYATCASQGFAAISNKQWHPTIAQHLPHNPIPSRIGCPN